LNRDQLEEPSEPTIYFIGVTTGKSSIMQVFPRWAEALGIDAVIRGIDLGLHAPAQEYRAVVEFIRNAEHARGALVTTHKLDLFGACRDKFDYIDPLADLMAEVSCISKRGTDLRCHAKDPITGGLAVDAIFPTGRWQGTGADAFFMGAGGSTIAITWHLMQSSRQADRPRRIHVSNRSQPRLDHIAAVHASIDTDASVEYHLCPEAADNDAVIRALPSGSLIVNATGLGKDAPGSPITADVAFPGHATAWDLNYRGDLIFLDIASAATSDLGVRVEDGWIYFMHGWLQVVGEVFDIDIPTSGPHFQQLSALAGGAPRS
jgi:shikimate 5-dehydrogenase